TLTLSFTLLRHRRCPCVRGGTTQCGRPPPLLAVAPCGLVAGGRPLRVRREQPLAGWPLAIVPCGRAAANRLCRLTAAGRARGWPPLAGCCPCGRPPLAGGRQPPCRGALAETGRPWGGLVMASHPLAGGLGRSRLPLTASHGQPLLLVVLAVNALNDST
ncbi:hypothetical protein GW17_00056707, partial [Ensete ventricosum]